MGLFRNVRYKAYMPLVSLQWLFSYGRVGDAALWLVAKNRSVANLAANNTVLCACYNGRLMFFCACVCVCDTCAYARIRVFCWSLCICLQLTEVRRTHCTLLYYTSFQLLLSVIIVRCTASVDSFCAPALSRFVAAYLLTCEVAVHIYNSWN